MDNFIFIFGCGHSGTTILNKIIGNHKNIYGIENETGIFLKENDKEIIKNLANFSKERKKLGKKWICEKTPKHVYHINKIYKLTKNPKIIILIRDGRDVVASLFKRYGDFNKSIDRWINDNNQWLNSTHKKDFYILKYENFVKDPEEELKKIFNYIGEEYDDTIMDYNKETIELPEKLFDSLIDKNDHKLLRKYQINQDIYDGSKRYLKDLNEEQINILKSNKKFMNLMKYFEYE